MSNATKDPDATEHYSVRNKDEVPSLLVLIIDTNPRAWAALADTLTFDRAIANLQVFINAHLAFSNANQVAVLASHTTKALWLYPAPPEPKPEDGDVDMDDATPSIPPSAYSANKYPPFAQVEAGVVASLHKLAQSMTDHDLEPVTTRLAGALSMALAYANRASLSLATTATETLDAEPATQTGASSGLQGLRARIMIVSVSDSEPSQYIPTMNTSFAAAHLQIPIDTLSLFGNDIFMQQAASITSGTYLQVPNPRGLLQYLMMGFMADGEARKMLVSPKHHSVDFRAACICHRKVVDMGFVCSVCLGVFCEAPKNAECLLCGTKLQLGSYGNKPAVVPRKKRKKSKGVVNGAGYEEAGSAAGTPKP